VHGINCIDMYGNVVSVCNCDQSGMQYAWNIWTSSYFQVNVISSISYHSHLILHVVVTVAMQLCDTDTYSTTTKP